jgi:hypothetical protein
MAIEQENFLPCPFCGELPDFLPTTNRVYCFSESCGAGPEMQIASVEDHRAELVTAWNTRSSADVSYLTAELAELREQLRQRDEMLAAAVWIEFENGLHITQPCEQPEGSQCWHYKDGNLYDSALEAYAAIKGIDNAPPKLML